MAISNQYDAIVVGSGPNGLAAAITLARAKLSVLLMEAGAELGGGLRSAELTLPGFIHDVCSAIHPLAVASPIFSVLPLADHGLEWIHSPLPLAHPLDDGQCAWQELSLGATARSLGGDGPAYEALLNPLVANWGEFIPEVMQPVLHWPRTVQPLVHFGIKALRSACGVADQCFKYAPAKALLAGLAAHSFLPLQKPGSAATALVLGAAGHAVGWPMARGGSQGIANALAAYYRELGGNVETGHRVETIDELPPADVVLLDVSPRQLLAMAGHRLPSGYCQALRRYRYGPGIFKIDYALNHPIPWTSPRCREAATVHVGGTIEEIAFSEKQTAAGEHAEKPFVLLVQPSLFDESRVPVGRHTAWAYCHVPNSSVFDMAGRIEAQIERFAPGFKDCVLARKTRNCADLENQNPNLIGGDICGGAADLRQLIARPALRFNPYKLPVKGWYLCSASTPPGGGVHGMCGFNAARHALKFLTGGCRKPLPG